MSLLASITALARIRVGRGSARACWPCDSMDTHSLSYPTTGAEGPGWVRPHPPTSPSRSSSPCAPRTSARPRARRRPASRCVIRADTP
jgi:hypothetical protein